MIDPRALEPLRLGAEAIRRLLPHRPPLLLVDGVTAFSAAPAAVAATRHVSTGEPVFAGHFPDLWLWPGVYTIEGLAQACALLETLLRVREALAAGGRDLSALAALDRPLEGEGGDSVPGVKGGTGLLVAVDVKLTRPVLAGQRLDYLVVKTHDVGEMHRFDVEASVDRKTVAKGTLTSAVRSPA